MIRYISKLPFFKRVIPSLGIRVLKILGKNRGFFKINGINFFLDFLDPVDRQIIIHKKYEEDSVKYFCHEIDKHSFSFFFDIGSNSGYYSFYLRNKYPFLKVSAFEPNVDAYSKFTKTLLKNEFDNIKVYNFGLSDENKKQKMITWIKHGYAKTNSTILNKSHDLQNSKVFQASFKVGDEMFDYKKEKICIKIDVEGHELQVLKGLEKNLINNQCLILIEIADSNFKVVNDYLEKKKFRIIYRSNYRLDYFYTNIN